MFERGKIKGRERERDQEPECHTGTCDTKAQTQGLMFERPAFLHCAISWDVFAVFQQRIFWRACLCGHTFSLEFTCLALNI